MPNVLHLSKLSTVKTEQASYSDNVYESIPFSCEAGLSDENLNRRINTAIHKKYPNRHYAGLGYSCSILEILRETKTSGHVLVMHYYGIGD